MGGLLNRGHAVGEQGRGLMRSAAAMEYNRDQTNKQISDAKFSGTIGNMATGAGIGASVGGPWGAAIGGAAGLLVSLF